MKEGQLLIMSNEHTNNVDLNKMVDFGQTAHLVTTKFAQSIRTAGIATAASNIH